MKTNIQVDDPLFRTVSVELPWPLVAEELDRAYRELGRKVELKGFRKGKVPRAVLEKRFGQQVREDVLDRLIQDSYEAALIQHKVRPVARPELRRGELQTGQPFAYSVRVEVQPDIELKQTDGFELQRPGVDVTPEQVDAELEHLRESRAVLVPIEDRNDARLGDTAILDYEASRDEKPLPGGGKRDHTVELGAGQTVPGFDAEIVGLTVGAEKRFELTYPTEGVPAELAGKQVGFKVVLQALKRRELPALDDEFAVDLGQAEVKTLAELRAHLERQLRQRGEAQAERELRDALVDKLIAANPFPAPPSLVARQQEAMVREMESFFSMQGVDGSKLGLDREKMKKDMAERAEREVRAALLLAAVAERDGLVVDDDALEAHMKELAVRSGQNEARVRALYAESPRREELRLGLRRERTLDHLLKKSNMVGRQADGATPPPGETT